MTNNLKILVILSIFVFILTGYFYFSSPSVKNQIIANSNDKEEKDNRKITGINNEDNNNNEEKDNEEKTSKLSILKIIIIVILIVIIIGVIVFVFVNFIFVNEEEEEVFEFNEKSKEDFARENFCPTFFAIDHKCLKGDYYDAEQNAKWFFEILASEIVSEIFNEEELEELKSKKEGTEEEEEEEEKKKKKKKQKNLKFY